MQSKKNLSPGIYVNHEYPPHIKKARDKQRPILKLAKGLPHYRNKSKLEDDKLVINGIRYTIDDIGKLPPDLAAYQVAQRLNDESIVFQGELSPWSNFHKAPFIINSQRFETTEHWIQLQKALLFNDPVIANKILNSTSPYEAKKLGHQVNGMDHQKWKEEGYNLCFEGIKAKFQQNPDLMNVLKTQPLSY